MSTVKYAATGQRVLFEAPGGATGLSVTMTARRLSDGSTAETLAATEVPYLAGTYAANFSLIAGDYLVTASFPGSGTLSKRLNVKDVVSLQT